MYTLRELRLNETIELSHPSLGTFDVRIYNADLDVEKWVSIPHELFFDFIEKHDGSLYNYIHMREFSNWEEVIIDLLSIGFDFKQYILDYVTACYSKFTFECMPSYDPDFILHYDS